MQERLQKIIAAAGIASRREAEKLISEGKVSVKRRVVTQPGTKADVQKDEIRVDGKLISAEISKVYLMLNKPPGYITSLNDPQGRPIVTDLLRGVSERIFPVGRLDYDSEGLLLMTNDGSFAHRIAHPKFVIPKTYRVKVKGNLTRGEIRAIEKGVELDDGRFVPSVIELEKINRKSCWFQLTIFEGRNRIIRRVFESMGYSVVRLIRVAVSDIQLDDLKTGEYRHLRKREVERLLSLSK
ncbi:MAG: rRNA pseudouridine synthase [Proteobacteria bacterium]|nr:rRNA pseudouridine synthase [Pseudomonadota bacterium]